ncbi:MAG: 3-methyladenine glycosylase/8-oxoguanine glycosylase-like protein [Frankiales bacterium]|nr:3-methyladenine glycosylase/8-oxoguanine glycosylase-like protein [Frankiales bacterium]
MITPRGAFSLRELALFGFGQRHAPEYDGTMRLAFCLDGSWEPVGVSVTQPAPDSVVVDGPAEALDQTLRVLSLDVDARSFADVPDPLIQRLQAVAPGLRPPLFHSAYEALAWCVLSARRPAKQMQNVRAELSRRHGTVLPEGLCFPTPTQLLTVDAFPGLDAVKVERLHAIARAALDGSLDTPTLRAQDPAQVTADLQRLPGIGPFSASLVVLRALGHTDLLPEDEKNALALVGEHYGLGRPATSAELQQIGRAWAPWRLWSLVLIRAASRRLPAAV